jgi:hypothetical protein
MPLFDDPPLQDFPEEMDRLAAQVAKTWEQELLTRGRAEGEVRTPRDSVALLLRERFGSLPEALAAQIAEIEDPERLWNSLRQVVHVHSLEDLTL